MAIRILMMLIALFLLTNIIITIVSLVCGVNLYQKHGKTIIKGYGIFILFVIATYVVLALLGLN